MAYEFQYPPITNAIADKNGTINYAWQEWLLDLTKIQKEIITFKTDIDPANVIAATTVAQAFTVTTVVDDDGNTVTLPSGFSLMEVGDIVLRVEKPTLSTGLGVLGGRVTAQNQITIEFTNPSGGAVNAGSETYTIVIMKG